MSSSRNRAKAGPLRTLLTIGCAIASCAAHAQSFGLHEEESRFLPGMYYFHKGCAYYSRGDSEAALSAWEIAAGWGVKDAQYDLGIAYLRGLGVPIDKPRGLAWLALSAERNDALFEETLASAWNAADDGERNRANAIWRDLKKSNADAVALRRARIRYRQEIDTITGSRVGMPGHVTVWTSDRGPMDVAFFKEEMDRRADLNFGKLPEGSVVVEPLQPIVAPGMTEAPHD